MLFLFCLTCLWLLASVTCVAFGFCGFGFGSLWLLWLVFKTPETAVAIYYTIVYPTKPVHMLSDLATRTRRNPRDICALAHLHKCPNSRRTYFDLFGICGFWLVWLWAFWWLGFDSFLRCLLVAFWNIWHLVVCLALADLVAGWFLTACFSFSRALLDFGWLRFDHILFHGQFVVFWWLGLPSSFFKLGQNKTNHSRSKAKLATTEKLHPPQRHQGTTLLRTFPRLHREQPSKATRTRNHKQ